MDFYFTKNYLAPGSSQEIGHVLSNIDTNNVTLEMVNGLVYKKDYKLLDSTERVLTKDNWSIPTAK